MTDHANFKVLTYTEVSGSLLVFAVFSISMALIFHEDTALAPDAPPVAFIAVWVAIAWFSLSKVERGQASLVDLPPVDHKDLNHSAPNFFLLDHHDTSSALVPSTTSRASSTLVKTERLPLSTIELHNGALLSAQKSSYSLGPHLSLNKAATSLETSHGRWVHKLKENPNLKIAVIGGGIYGCHFANVFKKACEEVSACTTEPINAKLTIFEKDEILFSQASGKNSFRIHKGFHYPRSGNTRRMCYTDHHKFCLLYPSFFQAPNGASNNVKGNQSPAFPKLFAIAKGENTIIDYEAMRNLLAGAKYEAGGTSMWNEVDGELWNEDIRKSGTAALMRDQMRDLGFNADLIDGAFLVQAEPILYADAPRTWFTQQFTKSPFVELVMQKRVDRADIQEGLDGDLLVHQEPFDLALNCTYNQAIPMQPTNHRAFYDLCLSVIVAEKPNHGRMPALSFGIFDGPFPSLEPYDFSSRENLPAELKKFADQNLFQIFDVELSSIARSCDAETAYKLMASWEEKKRVRSEEYEEAVQGIWAKCQHYFPRLGEDFELAGTWFALKTKVEDKSASRPVVVLSDDGVDRQGRFIQVFSSKLTSIFGAEEEVLGILENIA